MTVLTDGNQLSINNFATISGIRGKQFGREVYSTVIQFKDLMTFLQVFPDVQRDVSNRRINAIRNYVLSGLEEKDNGKKRWAVMRFFSAITVTARGNIFYDEDAQRLAIDTKESKLSINDGQHRFYGISEAIRSLNAMYNRVTDPSEKENVLSNLTELQNMVIPIVIFNGIDESEEKQLFHDLNNLAQRPSRSATIRLAQTDLYAKLSREIAEENVFLSTYGVETDKMSIHKNNKNLILLTTIHYVVRELIEVGEESLLHDNYEMHKKTINGIFESIFESLPEDISTKGKYLIEKNYAFKGIAKFIIEAKKANLKDKAIYQAIKETDWTNNLQSWSAYGATEGKSGILFAGGDGGVKAVLECLSDKAGIR
jgi:DNA sulfur modification protein DndB